MRHSSAMMNKCHVTDISWDHNQLVQMNSFMHVPCHQMGWSCRCIYVLYAWTVCLILKKCQVQRNLWCQFQHTGFYENVFTFHFYKCSSNHANLMDLTIFTAKSKSVVYPPNRKWGNSCLMYWYQMWSMDSGPHHCHVMSCPVMSTYFTVAI